MPITFPLNEWQKIAARVYGDGCFALYAEDDSEISPDDKECLQVNHVGDTNFFGLMVELDESEDCRDGEQAVTRLNTIIEDMSVVRDALALVK